MAQRYNSWAPSPSYCPPRPSGEGYYSYETKPSRLPSVTAITTGTPESSYPRGQQPQYYRPDQYHPHEYHQTPSPIYQSHPPQHQQHQPQTPHTPHTPQPPGPSDPYRSAPMPRHHAQETPQESPTVPPASEPVDEYQAAREQHFKLRNQPPPMPPMAPGMVDDNYQGKVPIPFTPPSLRIPAVRSGSSLPTAGASWSATSNQSDRVKIEDLLSDTPAQTAQPAPDHVPSPVQNEYEIFFRQQPVAARCCGYGEKDRRVIDPPPIVQLKINNPNLTPDEMYQKLHHPAYVVYCSIWDQDGKEDTTNMHPEFLRPGKRMMGSLVSSPFVGQDDKGEEGCFFCFPDMSVRTAGYYRLKFVLVVVDPTHRSKRAPIKSAIMSTVFKVYTAKEFPGMQASTPLTKRLKEQGCLISIKKGNEKSSGKKSRRKIDSYDDYVDEDDDDDDDDDEECGSSSKRKKLKKEQR